MLIHSGFEDVYDLIADFEKGFTRLRHVIILSCALIKILVLEEMSYSIVIIPMSRFHSARSRCRKLRHGTTIYMLSELSLDSFNTIKD